MIKINFVGDINPGGVLTFMGGVSQGVIDCLADADLRVGTLESAIGDGSTMCTIKMADPQNGAIIYSPDETIATLKRLNINVVTLANNHLCDLDVEGLRHTINLLEENDILYLGAGEDIKQASKPLFVDVKGKKVCFLAYMEDCVPGIRFAKEKAAGVNPFNPQKVVEDIKHYKGLSDFLVVLPHWGKENTIWPKLKVMMWCRMFKNAGADAIIASHTHVAQPVVVFGNTVMAPSLGNFLFPDRYINKPRITVYPSPEERSNPNLPIAYTYPLVKELTYKLISDLSRVGEILSVCFEKDCTPKTHTQFVQLDEANTLHVEEPSSEIKEQYNKVLRMLNRPYAFIILQLVGITVWQFAKRVYESPRLRRYLHLKQVIKQ